MKDDMVHNKQVLIAEIMSLLRYAHIDVHMDFPDIVGCCHMAVNEFILESRDVAKGFIMNKENVERGMI